MDRRELDEQDDARVRQMIERGIDPITIAANEPHLKGAIARVTGMEPPPDQMAATVDMRLQLAEFAAEHPDIAVDRGPRCYDVTNCHGSMSDAVKDVILNYEKTHPKTKRRT